MNYFQRTTLPSLHSLTFYNFKKLLLMITVYVKGLFCLFCNLDILSNYYFCPEKSIHTRRKPIFPSISVHNYTLCIYACF